MTRKTAQVGVPAWFARGLEAKDFLFTLLEHLAVNDDLLRFRDELTAFGGLWILGHLVGGQSDLLEGAGLDEDEVVRGDVGVVEFDANRLTRLGRDLAESLLVLAQIRFRHVCGGEEHLLLNAGNLHLEKVLLAVELSVSLGFLRPLIRGRLLEKKGMHLRVGLFDSFLVPEFPHRGRTKRGLDGIRQMPFTGQSGDVSQDLEGLLGSDVTAGNGRLHADESVLVLARLGEKGISILGQAMPVTQLTSGRRPGIMVVAGKYFAQQGQVGLLDVSIGPDGLDLMMPKALVFGIQIGDPIIEGGFDFAWVHFP